MSKRAASLDWVFIDHVVAWHPEVSSFDTSMHSGILRQRPKIEARRMGMELDPLSIIINTFELRSVFKCAAYWIVSEDARSAVEPLVKAEFLEVKIAGAFSCPYGPGHREAEEGVDVYKLGGMDRAITQHFLPRFRCKPPPTRFYEMLVPYILDDPPQDAVAVDIYSEIQVTEGVVRTRDDPMIVSPNLLKQHGVTKSVAGLASTPEVFDVLGPQLRDRYYWIRPYRFSDGSPAHSQQ